jgi:hypothetical protein
MGNGRATPLPYQFVLPIGLRADLGDEPLAKRLFLVNGPLQLLATFECRRLDRLDITRELCLLGLNPADVQTGLIRELVESFDFDLAISQQLSELLELPLNRDGLLLGSTSGMLLSRSFNLNVHLPNFGKQLTPSLVHLVGAAAAGFKSLGKVTQAAPLLLQTLLFAG